MLKDVHHFKMQSIWCFELECDKDFVTVFIILQESKFLTFLLQWSCHQNHILNKFYKNRGARLSAAQYYIFSQTIKIRIEPICNFQGNTTRGIFHQFLMKTLTLSDLTWYEQMFPSFQKFSFLVRIKIIFSATWNCHQVYLPFLVANKPKITVI